MIPTETPNLPDRSAVDAGGLALGATPEQASTVLGAPVGAFPPGPRRGEFAAIWRSATLWFSEDGRCRLIQMRPGFPLTVGGIPLLSVPYADAKGALRAIDGDLRAGRRCCTSVPLGLRLYAPGSPAEDPPLSALILRQDAVPLVAERMRDAARCILDSCAPERRPGQDGGFPASCDAARPRTARAAGGWPRWRSTSTTRNGSVPQRPSPMRSASWTRGPRPSRSPSSKRWRIRWAPIAAKEGDAPT